MPTSNPYESPDEFSIQKLNQEVVPPSVLWALLLSAVLAIGLGLSFLVAGRLVGFWIYHQNEIYYIEKILGEHADPTFEWEFARSQVANPIAVTTGGIGFWGGLLLPWLRFGYLRYRYGRKQTQLPSSKLDRSL